MKISKDSWHYKLLLEWGWNIPDNLCTYVLKILLSVLLYPALGVGSLIISANALAPFVFIGCMWLGVLPHELVVFFSIVGSFFYVVYAMCLVLSWVPDFFNWLSNRPSKHREPNVFTEYVKAKHSKICPVLEFTE